MSDAEILRALQLNIGRLHSKMDQGDDGDTVIYTDDLHEIWSTRSVVSGVIVIRMKPQNAIHTWELEKP